MRISTRFTHPAFDVMLSSQGLSKSRLILPLFIVDGLNQRQPIEALPGQFRWSADTVVEEAQRIADLGIPAVLLFGQSPQKNAQGSLAWQADGTVQRAIQAIKQAVPQLFIISDVCLCAYTEHGHCRVLKEDATDPSEWLVAPTLDAIAKTALSHAQAGADMVAPSDKNPGNVKAIRALLDVQGFESLPILSYTLKYASAFYGPFRDAVDSSPQFGDRRSYQMDPHQSHDVLGLVKQDLADGADAVMVKPAAPYLDVVRQTKDVFDVPLAAYQVSGEYAMIKAAAARGALDETKAMMEMLQAIHRAGADWIITYWAKEFAALENTDAL